MPKEDQPSSKSDATEQPVVATSPPPDPPAPAADDEAATASELVRARWVGMPVFNPEQGLVSYGDEILVTAEQLDDQSTQAIAWADDWRADQQVLAMIPKEN